MVLITGGAYQGKSELAKKLGFDSDKILYNAHEVIRQLIEDGGEPEQAFFDMLRSAECVTCDEIGMGIVPVDGREREWRETVGRIMCGVAQRADTVYRVVCGIPVKIKG